MSDRDASYTIKRGSVYYFSRRVPEDLRGYYKLNRIVISLKTRSQKAAQTKASSLATKLDEDWLTLRWRSSSDPFARYLVSDQRVLPAGESTQDTSSDAPRLSEAKDLYLGVKGKGRPKTFHQAADRSVGYMTTLLGDRHIDTYSRMEINQLRDALGDKGLATASIKRTFGVLRAIVNFASREHGLPDITVFSGVYLGEPDDIQETKRLPIPLEGIQRVQVECKRLDDEARWLIALISDTGMRLSEAAGLITSDVVMGGEHPHIVLKPHPWRRLKNKGSERIVPLVGASLWATQRATSRAHSPFLFPKYTSEKGCKANAASAALNKWLSPRVPDGCVIHSFRHSMRDRLRAVECPPDIIDRIGGWSVAGVGEGYGQGYPIAVLHKWILRAV